MSDLAHSLFVKYGLRNRPTAQQVAQWVSITEDLISCGTDAESAGARAAKKIFPDFGDCVYKSHADTILALLAAAKKK